MLLALILAGYLTLWPVPVEPVVWHAPTAIPYAVNDKLQAARIIPMDGEAGPEHIVPGPDGLLYMGMVSGHIVRMAPDGSAQQRFSDTGGRPLGMAFNTDGHLVVADGVKGLLSVAPDGAITVLDGAIPFANAVAVTTGGKIYVTSSSARFKPATWGGTEHAATLDVIEQSATGRVFVYDPANGSTRVVARGLSLANGIALSADQQHLFVSESGRYRVWKIAVTANDIDVATGAPQAQILIANLPGYPDNLTSGLRGKLWLGLAGSRNDLDALADQPWLRKMLLRVPRVLWPTPKPHGHVMAFSEDGKVIADLQDDSGASAITTGATETVDGLYIHSLNSRGVAWLPAR